MDIEEIWRHVLYAKQRKKVKAMGVIIHRLPADEIAAKKAHHELMKRRLLSGLYAARQQQHTPTQNRRARKPINTV